MCYTSNSILIGMHVCYVVYMDVCIEVCTCMSFDFCCSVKSPRPPIVNISAVIDKRYMYTARASILILYTLYIMYLMDRLHGLSEGVVSDIHLHEQPTGLNPVQRTSLYTKKLTWCSKLKPPHSFITATSSASSIRHRLGSSSKRKGNIAY